jgi:hypothetical protein
MHRRRMKRTISFRKSVTRLIRRNSIPSMVRHHRNSISPSYRQHSLRQNSIRRSLSRTSSRVSIGSARSMSRSKSPVFPKTHFRTSTRQHGKVNSGNVPSEYHINREISNLASQFSKTRRGNSLPPISIPNTSGSSEWPSNIPVYVISINTTRQERFKGRFNYPSKIWKGTNGKTMDVGKLKREGILMSSSLTRGEIGCYDSHLRLWETLIREKTPMAIICEDDVNLTGDTNQAKYFNTLLEEIKPSNFDILFLSWFRPDGGVRATSHTRHQWCFHQLWAYLVTYDGLVKVMNDIRVRKMHMPVDVALWDAHSRGVIRNIVAYPPLCLTVGEHSDTQNIR